MLYQDPCSLSAGEKEIVLLKAVMESINSMVNRSVFTLHCHDQGASVIPKTHIHQQYFNILLLDFLSLETFESRKADILERLRNVCDLPSYNDETQILHRAVTDFKSWLEQDVEFENDGEVRQLYFSSINKEVVIQITRDEFIRICGNISKHNPLGLDRQAKAIKKIFNRNSIDLDLADALLIMDEFYEQFHDDLLNYHISTIAEFLNNIRWAIYEYLKPLYRRSRQDYWDERFNMMSYRFQMPDDVKNEYVRKLFWDLMNDVRRGPYMPRFRVARYLKMRY